MTEEAKDPKANAGSAPVSVLRFIVTYVVLMGLFFLLIGLKPVQEVFNINDGYSHVIVFMTAKILGLIGIPVTTDGSLMHLPSISLDVEFGCNGLEAVMIYTVAVLTFPATWKERLVGITGGFLVIQVLNLIRIVGLAYAGVYHRELFDVIHLYVAQGVMIAVALGTFVLYLTYINRKQGKGEEAVA